MVYSPIPYPFPLSVRFLFFNFYCSKGQFDKFGFVVLELALLCGRYLELVETNQPSLCKGRGTTKWWKDCLVGSNR